MVLEKTLESPLDKEIKPVNPKRNQPRIFIGRTDTEAETPILWPPDAMSWLTEKTLMLGKIEGGRKRGGQRMRWLDGITNVMTWVWVNSGSWWWTGRPGVLQNMGSQGVGHNWVTELSWTESKQLPETSDYGTYMMLHACHLVKMTSTVIERCYLATWAWQFYQPYHNGLQ